MLDVTNPTEAQTRRALAWARSPDHPYILAMLDGCPDLTWNESLRSLVATDPYVVVELRGDLLRVLVMTSHGSQRREVQIPRHILHEELRRRAGTAEAAQ